METIQHNLQQFDPGIVWLDADNMITGMNQFAATTLGDQTGQLIGRDVLQIHPQASRSKVKFLIDHAASSAEANPPMTMMINIPERVLLIKVSKICGPDGEQVGTCMIFYDVTELTEEPAAEAEAEGVLQLSKLPVYKDQQVLLVELETVACIKAEGHYSTLYAEADQYLCNLSLANLEERIRLPHFIRVHRSYIVNMRFAKAFEKADEQCFLVLDYDDDLRVPISRNNVAKLKSLLGLN